jgi:hypothetical protein
VLAVLVLTSCQTAYYAAMEKLGYPKRDLLVSRVQQARDSQQAAKEQFQSALERYRTVINFRGGELEAKYNELSAELERSEARAQTVHQRIAAVEDVAEALFKEWEGELAQYTNESLRRASARQLAQTRQRYTPLLRTMKRAEATMTPVLTTFRDQVLFLKHNLNARAIAATRQEGWRWKWRLPPDSRLKPPLWRLMRFSRPSIRAGPEGGVAKGPAKGMGMQGDRNTINTIVPVALPAMDLTKTLHEASPVAPGADWVARGIATVPGTTVPPRSPPPQCLLGLAS